jgi:hypothetical protein
MAGRQVWRKTVQAVTDLWNKYEQCEQLCKRLRMRVYVNVGEVRGAVGEVSDGVLHAILAILSTHLKNC